MGPAPTGRDSRSRPVAVSHTFTTPGFAAVFTSAATSRPPGPKATRRTASTVPSHARTSSPVSTAQSFRARTPVPGPVAGAVEVGRGPADGQLGVSLAVPVVPLEPAQVALARPRPLLGQQLPHPGDPVGLPRGLDHVRPGGVQVDPQLVPGVPESLAGLAELLLARLGAVLLGHRPGLLGPGVGLRVHRPPV